MDLSISPRPYPDPRPTPAVLRLMDQPNYPPATEEIAIFGYQISWGVSEARFHGMFWEADAAGATWDLVVAVLVVLL